MAAVIALAHKGLNFLISFSLLIVVSVPTFALIRFCCLSETAVVFLPT